MMPPAALPDPAACARAALSLLAVLGAMAGFTLLIRRPGAPLQAAPPANLRRAAVIALDRTRRLHLVEVEGLRVLALCGGAGDVLLTLPPAGPPSADAAATLPRASLPVPGA